ncbi:hypothetical protein Y032_0001g486 [Ancylostoma ceylanicum]|uniref:Uncharacterized protein n=1 Tax=Ancylostoma ceylanicum TaxID=53326 RepID=A0A016W445_9BILA|nr:hypothetical protein Y032_0001g486 [Ancylostoma ceylanicum]
MADDVQRDSGESGADPQPKIYQLTSDDLDKLLQARREPSRTQSQPKHTFAKTGLARQFEFDAELLDIIIPICEVAQKEGEIKLGEGRGFGQKAQ